MLGVSERPPFVCHGGRASCCLMVPARVVMRRSGCSISRVVTQEDLMRTTFGPSHARHLSGDNLQAESPTVVMLVARKTSILWTWCISMAASCGRRAFSRLNIVRKGAFCVIRGQETSAVISWCNGRASRNHTYARAQSVPGANRYGPSRDANSFPPSRAVLTRLLFIAPLRGLGLANCSRPSVRGYWKSGGGAADSAWDLDDTRCVLRLSEKTSRGSLKKRPSSSAS